MSLYFVTGNKNKYQELQALIPKSEMLDIDLPEIQDIDPKKIIKAKLLEASKQTDSPCIVEDTSLYIDALGGLPGPLIKWFMKTLGNEGIADLVSRYTDSEAYARTIIGYHHNGRTEYFEGEIVGNIVPARGENGFGWDPIFQITENNKTFAELSADEKI
jgi:non-canonical purine NTP pyrophosphatase (RdgB/HAM1 family)